MAAIKTMTDFKRYPCLCCGYLTMWTDVTGSFDICEVCGWGDDNVQASKPDSPSGANRMSLNQARANFASYGAKSREALEWVRKPLPEEIPPS